MTTLNLNSSLYDSSHFTLDNGDTFTLNADLKTISFTTLTGTGVDNIRIITATFAAPVPAVWFMGKGLLGLMGCSYKNKAQIVKALSHHPRCIY